MITPSRTAPREPSQKTGDQVRVAIYCRKSTDKGLKQEFNSLDAQREAVEAYVASQKAKSWIALDERYDDGGFTGANTERPAFKRLMADVESGAIDVVAVHKFDRLSRSQLDLLNTVKTLREHGVAFVSVTQQLDTNTSMGRYMLNLMTAFAELEREVISERTRDKIHASRRKGIWTGGYVPLGYDIKDKRLVVNPKEADQVRRLFSLYVEEGSLSAAVEVARLEGLRTKRRQSNGGSTQGGTRFNKNSLRAVLKNPVYLGRMRLGDDTFDGQHEAIVDEETWDAVHTQLAYQRAARRSLTNARSGALLAGLVTCARCGAPMGPHHAQRGPRRYTSYVCQTIQKQNAQACPGSRCPAHKLEGAIVDQIKAIGRDPDLLSAVLRTANEDREAQRPAVVDERDRLAQHQRELGTERSNLLDAIGKGEGRRIPSLVDRLAEVDQELEEARERAQVIARDIRALDTPSIDEDDLRAALTEFTGLWEQLTSTERARCMNLLIDEIKFDGPEAEMQIRFRRGTPRTLLKGDSKP